MRHHVAGRKLKRTASHKKALMRNLAMALFEHKKIGTTEAKAKELRPYAERLITKAKHALAREKQGLLPDGQTIDIHNRRLVGRVITNKAVLQELFDTIAPTVETRQGGYTRIIKTGTRRGDASMTALIELVDWSAPQDGAYSLKSKKKHPVKGKVAAKPVKKSDKTPIAKEEKLQPIEEMVEEVIDEPITEELEVVAEPAIEEEEPEIVIRPIAKAPEPETIVEEPAPVPEEKVAEQPSNEITEPEKPSEQEENKEAKSE